MPVVVMTVIGSSCIFISFIGFFAMLPVKKRWRGRRRKKREEENNGGRMREREIERERERTKKGGRAEEK